MKLLLCCACVVVLAWTFSPTVTAQSVDDVFPLEPENDGVVGPRPKIRLGVRGTDVTKMRFRIRISRDDSDKVAYTFDQKEDPNGWAYIVVGFDQPGALYMVRKPLDDGVYQWRASAWNGVSWIDGKETHRMVVDAVPPADVTNVRTSFDSARGATILDWDPVAFDREGRPEVVARYHVYRYFMPSFFFSIGIFHVAELTETHYEDATPEARNAKLVFYKITAEDLAGNEAERRY